MNDHTTSPTLTSHGQPFKRPLLFTAVALAIAASLQCTATAASFSSYVIRNGTAAPYSPPAILVNNAYPGYQATEFVISGGGQKAGYGSSDIDGSTLGSIANIAIARLDDTTRFALGSGGAFAPYLNIWITDGLGHYAVVANEPTDPEFQALFENGYSLSFADLANKVAKVYENSDLSWLPAAGSSGLPAQAGRQNPLSATLYTFADLAGYIIETPPSTLLAGGWPGLGSGAPRELVTYKAWGVNWIFGDTLANYVSGMEGFVVANPSVSASPLVVSTTVATVCNTVFGTDPSGKHVVEITGDAPEGFGAGSFASDGLLKTDMYFTPVALFGRSVQLGEVARLSYWTKKGSTHVAATGDWFVNIYTKPYAGQSGGGWYGMRIGTEPYFSENLLDPATTWNQWTTDGAVNQLRFFESTYGYYGSYSDLHWAAFISGTSLAGVRGPGGLEYAAQEVLSFSLQTASGWAAGFNGQVDGLTIELHDGSIASVDLEPVIPVVSDSAVTPSVAAYNPLGNITVTATLSACTLIGKAEFKIDVIDHWFPMNPVDLTFDGSVESVTGTIALGDAGITGPGVYEVFVRGYTAAGILSDAESVMLAVYDPTAGFVTGGGWVQSKSGDLFGTEIQGRANFGFVSKYQKNAQIPTGTTEFVFTAGALSFTSSTYQWLIVNNAGQNANFKGVGTINGLGNYGFMIWAYDGAQSGNPDTFRIQIWDKDNDDAIVYDNKSDQVLGGGSIIVHTPKR